MAPTPESTSIVTTLGVELEFTLAFHEDCLVRALESHDYSNPRKLIIRRGDPELNKNLRWILAPSHALIDTEMRPTLRSWAFFRHTSDPEYWWLPEAQWPGEERPRVHLLREIRGYWDEHLVIANHILADVHLASDVVAEKSRSTYTTWEFHSKPALTGLAERRLHQAFRDRIAYIFHWDSIGIEMKSPIFHISDSLAAQRSIYDYLNRLNGGPTTRWGITPQKYGGVHCHVGFDLRLPHLIPTLQHIAFLWILYEPIILLLFPPHRRGFDPSITYQDSHSNRLSAIAWLLFQGAPRVTISILGREIFFPLNAATCPNTYAGIIRLFKIMHHITNLQKGTRYLASLQGVEYQSGTPAGLSYNGCYHKGMMLNWYNMLASVGGFHGTALPQPDDKPTLEFRLMESNTSHHDVWMYVHLCVMICKAGERMALAEPPPETRSNYFSELIPGRLAPEYWSVEMGKYTGGYVGETAFPSLSANLDREVYVEEFWNLLGMQDAARDFWMWRWRKYRPEGNAEMEVASEPSVGSEADRV